MKPHLIPGVGLETAATRASRGGHSWTRVLGIQEDVEVDVLSGGVHVELKAVKLVDRLGSAGVKVDTIEIGGHPIQRHGTSAKRVSEAATNSSIQMWQE